MRPTGALSIKHQENPLHVGNRWIPCYIPLLPPRRSYAAFDNEGSFPMPCPMVSKFWGSQRRSTIDPVNPMEVSDATLKYVECRTHCTVLHSHFLKHSLCSTFCSGWVAQHLRMHRGLLLPRRTRRRLGIALSAGV